MTKELYVPLSELQAWVKQVWIFAKEAQEEGADEYAFGLRKASQFIETHCIDVAVMKEK